MARSRTAKENSKMPRSSAYSKRVKQQPEQSEDEPKRKELKTIHHQHNNNTVYSTINFPTDISIMTSHSENKCDAENTILHPLLGNKFMEHQCNDSICCVGFPEIIWNRLNENTEFVCTEGIIWGDNDTHHVCDEKADKKTVRSATNSLNKVLESISSYSEGKLIDFAQKKGRVKNFTIEYSKCGSKCYYKADTEGLFEFIILILSPNEFLAFGSVYCHAFYYIPGFEYINSDGSSPNVCRECTEHYQDYDPLNPPSIIPLSTVLKNAPDFLKKVLDNRFH